MFLAGSRLDCGNNLPCNAKLCKSPEGSQFIRPIIPNGLILSDHTFLDDVFSVGTNEEI